MTKDFILLNKHLRGSSEHHDLVEQIEQKWSTEVREDGIATKLKAIFGMGYNLVPWQLMSLKLVRWCNRNVRFLVHNALFSNVSQVIDSMAWWTRF